jgi:hypothetical protein
MATKKGSGYKGEGDDIGGGTKVGGGIAGKSKRPKKGSKTPKSGVGSRKSSKKRY